MLFAERHGKLGRDGSRAHDRAEDLLTSTAFQLLRYLPLDVGLFAVLRRVRAVESDGRTSTQSPLWLKLEGTTEAKYEFWLHWGKYGEPDVVVTLFAGTIPVGRLVIEVKLDAGKSGEADEEEEESGEEAETASADQLAKYWQGLNVQVGSPALGVVYLTSHAVPPAEELAASLKSQPGGWLGWLSWRDVWSAVRNCAELPARDLTAILVAKRLKGFDGSHAVLPKPPLPASGRFWFQQRTRWFRTAPLNVARRSRFWLENKERK
jgi:hypothetical protein